MNQLKKSPDVYMTFDSRDLESVFLFEFVNSQQQQPKKFCAAVEAVGPIRFPGEISSLL